MQGRFPPCTWTGGGAARAVGQLPNNGPLGQIGEVLIRDHSGSRRPGTVRPSSAQRAISAL